MRASSAVRSRFREKGRRLQRRPVSAAQAATGPANLADREHRKPGAPFYCVNGQAEVYLILEFSDGTRVYVPASKIDLVQKYGGGSKTEPELSKLRVFAKGDRR